MNVSITKDSLLEKLGENLKAAKAEDARVIKEHRADEQAALKKFRDKLKAAMKLPYDEVKKFSRYGDKNLCFDAPPCPRLQATPIAKIIEQLKLDERKQPFNVV